MDDKAQERHDQAVGFETQSCPSSREKAGSLSQSMPMLVVQWLRYLG